MARKKTVKKKKGRKKKLQSGMPKIPVWLALAIVGVVTFLAYTPVLTADFVDIDDRKLILEKAPVVLEDPGWPLRFNFQKPHYKPITYYSWGLEYAIAGDDPMPFHLNNLLLHIFNSLLVFFLVRQIARQFERFKDAVFPIAFFSALLFGVHPMHVESVAWAVERKDVLFTFFYLLALLAYVRYLSNRSIWLLLASALVYALSVLSKAPGITVLPVLFLFDIAWKRNFGLAMLLDKLAHITVFLGALYCFGVFTRSAGEGSINAFVQPEILARAQTLNEVPTGYGRIMLASMRAWLWYLHSLFPFRLSIGYPREAVIGFFGQAIHIFPPMLAAAATFVVLKAKKNPLLFFTHGFFFITLLPAVARLGLGIAIFMSDRYVYLPVLGLIIWLTGLALSAGKDNPSRQKLWIGAVSAVALLFAVLTFINARNWKDPETLWSNVISKYPAVGYAHINRAAFYREQGRFDIALQDANNGVTIDPNPNALIQRGLILRQMGNPSQALSDYNAAIDQEPNNMQAHTNRGNAYLDMGQYQLAIRDYEKVLGSQPYNVRAGVNMAIAYASLNQYQQAFEAFSRVEPWAPGFPEFWINRGIMNMQLRRFSETVTDYENYLRYNPYDEEILNDIGIVCQTIGQHQRAVEYFSRALSLNPQRKYYLARAKSYDALGDSAAAQRDRQAAGQ